jgi:hypothetical protein
MISSNWDLIKSLEASEQLRRNGNLHKQWNNTLLRFEKEFFTLVANDPSFLVSIDVTRPSLFLQVLSLYDQFASETSYPQESCEAEELQESCEVEAASSQIDDLESCDEVKELSPVDQQDSCDVRDIATFLSEISTESFLRLGGFYQYANQHPLDSFQAECTKSIEKFLRKGVWISKMRTTFAKLRDALTTLEDEKSEILEKSFQEIVNFFKHERYEGQKNVDCATEAKLKPKTGVVAVDFDLCGLFRTLSRIQFDADALSVLQSEHDSLMEYEEQIESNVRDFFHEKNDLKDIADRMFKFCSSVEAEAKKLLIEKTLKMLVASIDAMKKIMESGEIFAELLEVANQVNLEYLLGCNFASTTADHVSAIKRCVEVCEQEDMTASQKAKVAVESFLQHFRCVLIDNVKINLRKQFKDQINQIVTKATTQQETDLYDILYKVKNFDLLNKMGNNMLEILIREFVSHKSHQSEGSSYDIENYPKQGENLYELLELLLRKLQDLQIGNEDLHKFRQERTDIEKSLFQSAQTKLHNDLNEWEHSLDLAVENWVSSKPILKLPEPNFANFVDELITNGRLSHVTLLSEIDHAKKRMAWLEENRLFLKNIPESSTSIANMRREFDKFISKIDKMLSNSYNKVRLEQLVDKQNTSFGRLIRAIQESTDHYFMARIEHITMEEFSKPQWEEVDALIREVNETRLLIQQYCQNKAQELTTKAISTLNDSVKEAKIKARQSVVNLESTKVLVECSLCDKRMSMQVVSKALDLLKEYATDATYQERVGTAQRYCQELSSQANILTLISAENYTELSERKQYLEAARDVLWSHLQLGFGSIISIINEAVSVLYSKALSEIQHSPDHDDCIHLAELIKFSRTFAALRGASLTDDTKLNALKAEANKAFNDHFRVESINRRILLQPTTDMTASETDRSEKQYQEQLQENREQFARCLVKNYAVAVQLNLLADFTKIVKCAIEKLEEEAIYYVGTKLFRMQNNPLVSSQCLQVIDRFPEFSRIQVSVFNRIAGGVTFETAKSNCRICSFRDDSTPSVRREVRQIKYLNSYRF